MANNNASTGNDNIVQGSGADTLTITNQNQLNANDFFNGGAGDDTINISRLSGLTVDLSVVTTSATRGFHNYEGLSFNNTSGTSGATLNAAQFGAGLISNSLDVTGAAGTQTLVINNATNFSAAAWHFSSWTSGTDTIAINGTNAADNITGSSQADTITGGNGNDIVHGGNGGDTIWGDNGEDKLYGEAGDDTINGGNGQDYLDGGDGNDKLFGDNGDDIITGGLGADILDGGKGANTFVYLSATDSSGSNFDTINGFVNGQDKIDLTTLLGPVDLVWGNTTPTARGVWVTHTGPNTDVWADTNGVSIARPAYRADW